MSSFRSTEKNSRVNRVMKDMKARMERKLEEDRKLALLKTCLHKKNNAISICINNSLSELKHFFKVKSN